MASLKKTPTKNGHRSAATVEGDGPILTRLADEQSADEARVEVFHELFVGNVSVGEAGGVVGLWRDFRRRLPVVGVFTVWPHHVVLFLLLRCVVKVVRSCEDRFSQTFMGENVMPSILLVSQIPVSLFLGGSSLTTFLQSEFPLFVFVFEQNGKPFPLSVVIVVQ